MDKVFKKLLRETDTEEEYYSEEQFNEYIPLLKSKRIFNKDDVQVMIDNEVRYDIVINVIDHSVITYGEMNKFLLKMLLYNYIDCANRAEDKSEREYHDYLEKMVIEVSKITNMDMGHIFYALKSDRLDQDETAYFAIEQALSQYE